MANEYISPNNFYDYSGSWNNEFMAYDGEVGRSANSVVPAHSWSNYLILNKVVNSFVTPFYCSKIKFDAIYHGTNGINKVDIDIYYYDATTGTGAWHDLYEGSFLNMVWVEKELGATRYLSQIRFRFYNNFSNLISAGLLEVMLYETVGIPTVTTNAATGVAGALATLNGNITSTGGEAPTIRGFEYKEGVDGTVLYAYDSGYFSTGAYSKALTGLDPTKKYYFRAYATNLTGGTGYGAWKSFGIDVDSPTVTTSAATGVGEDSATLNGNITATGGQDCEERGFQYKVGVDGEVLDLLETGTFGIGAYSLLLEDLENFTEYYFRAYAKNGAGTAYGSWLTFTTILANPTVKTHSATEILITQAKLNGEIVKTGAGIYYCFTRGFEYGLTKTPDGSPENTIEDNGGGEYYAGFFDKTPTGLLPNTKYWYRAYASFETMIGDM